MSGVAAAITVRGPFGPHDLGRLKKLPAAMTVRELILQIGEKLTDEQLDLPVRIGIAYEAPCADVLIVPARTREHIAIPAYLLIRSRR